MSILTKFEQLEVYINEANDILTNGNKEMAKKCCQKIIAVFCNEIDDITYGLDCQSAETYTEDRPINYLEDIYILKEKLVNYQINLQEKAVKLSVEKFSAHTASEEDIDTLKEMLAELLENMRTEKKESIVSKIFSFLADKGMDALIAMLPMVISGL